MNGRRSCAAGAFLVAAICSGSAFGQAIRCEDPKTGKVVYTDGTCPVGPGRLVAPAPSLEAMQLERERAQLARERLLVERERAALRAEQEAREAAQYGNITPQLRKSESYECEVARKNLGVGANPESKMRSQRDFEIACFGDNAAEIERARAGRPQTTVIIKR